jgi:NO-binding membrane sensor protein with MHYT domain
LIFVAIQGAYVGLSLAVQVGGAMGLRRRLLLAGAAISLAVAIWAMHFVAMIAARLPFPVDYLVLPTLLSFLVCVIVVGAAVFAVSAGPLTAANWSHGRCFHGAGIVSMHHRHVGAHASAHMTRDPAHVAAGVVVAIAPQALPCGSPAQPPPAAPRRGALGFAISGMHYTAMAGLAVFPTPWRRRREHRRSPPTSSPSSSPSSPSSSQASSCWRRPRPCRPAGAAGAEAGDPAADREGR